MTKTKEGTYFALIPGDELKLYGDRVIQIDTTLQYENNLGFGVYICEVLRPEQPEDEVNE